MLNTVGSTRYGQVIEHGRWSSFLRLASLRWLPRPTVQRVIGFLQGISSFRSILKGIAFSHLVCEAGAVDLVAVNKWFRLGVNQRITHSEKTVRNYVAKRGTRVIAFVQLRHHVDEHRSFKGCWLWSLAVKTPYRGLGIGEALTVYVMNQARTQGASEIFLTTFDDNLPAMALYRKLGFESIAILTMESRFGGTEPLRIRRRVTMRKSLN